MPDLHWAVPEPWTEDALCHERAHPDYWFPDGEGKARRKSFAARAAIAICHECPVQSECLNYALRADIRFGIWGGLTTYERRRGKAA